MTLSTRLTVFFLAALAAVLIAFSSVVYLLARFDLYEDAEDHLYGAMQTLAAAARIRPDGIEEPPEWHVSVAGGGILDNQIEWRVLNESGRKIVSSAQFPDLPEAAAKTIEGDRLERLADGQGRTWMHLRRTLSPKTATKVDTSPNKHAALIIDVAVHLDPIRRALARMAAAMAGASLAFWVLALFAGRWVCRRALRPVTRMADQAGVMGAERLRERLQVPESGDELQSLGESFNGLLNRLQEAFERQSQFAGNASHQLRTPLAGLLGQIEVALRHPRSAEDYRETLLKAQAGGQQLKQIIESLLFLTRADRDALAAGFEPIDVSAWVDTWAAAREGWPRRADLKILKPQGSIYVRVQPALLSQTLDNLFDNAAKYSPDGSPITLEISASPTSVVLAVENRGTGVPAAELDRVFEAFFRSEAARRSAVPGVGLGLAVVKRIVEAFGGSVRVQSEVGQSTRFEIDLPRATG